jgi:hypothetical protein
LTNLDQLLDAGARFDAEYGDGLTNHLPMALVALHRLGASQERLATFADRYAQRLAPAPAATAWRAGDAWVERLGDHDAWPAYRSLFAQRLADDGNSKVLRQVIPVLMRGCGAAAFHGLIRTAYAVQAGHTGELADALAYWACHHMVLGAAPDGQEKDPRVLLLALKSAFNGWSSDKALIFERMGEAGSVPAFASITARLRVNEDTLPALARHAAQLYGRSGNFTALHLVTSAHALRVLLQFTAKPLPAVGHYWCAFAAGFIASGLQPRQAVETKDWDALVAAALASSDDHLIKIVDSCREEELAYGGDDWRCAASRAVAQP